MWVKKLPHEIKKTEKNYLNPKWPAICSIGIFLIVAFSIKIGFNKWEVPAVTPITWEEFFAWGIEKATCIALLFGLIFYAWQLITKKQLFTPNPTLICQGCKRTKSFDNNLLCECGGQFISLEKMKWIKDEENL